MTFFESFAKWNGKFVDVDNAYGPQCMDWMHQFVTDVYGLDKTNLKASSAKQLFLLFPFIKGASSFQRIHNTLFNTPLQGDILFFNFGTDGHVAIFNEGNARRFTSIDQNFPTHSPVHLQEHTYGFLGKDVLGWLRFKK